MKERKESHYPAPFEITRKIYEKQRELSDTEYSYGLDWWFWALKEIPALEEGDVLLVEHVSEKVDELLENQKRLAFWSGGFDLGLHHSNVIATLNLTIPEDVLVVIGIESDSYIRRKGREPVFDQETRLGAVATLLKQQRKLAVAFPIPERPEDVPVDEFYESLVGDIGMFRREGCYHLYTLDEPYAEIKKQRMLEPEEWCEIPPFGLGGPLSVSEILNIKVKR